jgi:hypothetical protein
LLSFTEDKLPETNPVNPVMTRNAKSYTPPTIDEIASCAFSIFAQEQPHRAREAWLQAEAHLVARRQHDAGLLKIPAPLHDFREAFGK